MSEEKNINCSFQIHDWFICVFADVSLFDISGCAIDKLVYQIKLFEKRCNLDLFNRCNVALIQNGITKVVSIEDFKNITSSKDLIVYNNLVKTKQEFELNWKMPVHKSWYNRYFH